MRRRVLRRRLALAGFGAILAASAIGFSAPEAKADAIPGNCEVAPWGFLGLTQKRVICDGPLQPDGSWSRQRSIVIPAHRVPITTRCYGGYYSSSCTTTGGYDVDLQYISDEVYPVNPSIVLPDEPGHLG